MALFDADHAGVPTDDGVDLAALTALIMGGDESRLADLMAQTQLTDNKADVLPSAPPTADPAPSTQEAKLEELEDPDDEVDVPPKPRHKSLLEVNATVRVQRADPSQSALRSVKSWEELELPEDLLRGIYHKGFPRPSKIQEVALPLIREGRDLIAQAQNGSGKTAAFALSMLTLIERDSPHPQCLCLCPTRELAIQNLDVIRELGKFTSITSMIIVPMCQDYPREGAQIICGTPGKTRDFLQKRRFPTHKMQLLVLDEADVMIDRRQSMSPQVYQIRRFFKQKLQVLLFSATYSEAVRRFAMATVTGANRIQVEKENLTLSCVPQFFIECEPDKKPSILSELYGCMSIGQSVIFVNMRKTAFHLAKTMKDDGHAVSLICGTQTSGAERMDHEARERVMAEFRNGETKVLIATDVLSRGIDVPQVTLVVNYDLPLMRRAEEDRWQPPCVDMETYIHRVGRTGRFGLKGIAINLVARNEKDLLEDVRKFYGCDINALPMDPEEISKMVSGLR